jgi:hypothetical protein
MQVNAPVAYAILPQVARVIINDHKYKPLATHRPNPRRTNDVHMKQLSRLFGHHQINWFTRSNNHLAMSARKASQIIFKRELKQSSDQARKAH